VFVPMSPTPGISVLQIVPPDKLEFLQCSMSDALGWTLNWGSGTQEILKGVKDDRPEGPSAG